MNDEDKLSTLEDVRDNLIYVLSELNKNKMDFGYYIDGIQQSIDEMTEEIEELEEEQNHIWREELKQADREFESMRI